MAGGEEGRSLSALMKVAGMGAITLALYVLLFKNEATVLSVSSQGKWYFIVPIVIAFVFSFFHGDFTGRFWDYLGVKAKK